MDLKIVYFIVSAAVIVALGLLWWQHLKLKRTYSMFFDHVEPASLQRRLTGYAQDVEDALNKLDQLASFSAKLHKKSLQAITKIGLVRFNPFGDTGGDQSFCLVLLDSGNSGLSISSIHARSGTRFYAKEIHEGKPSHPLSEEEQAAYQKAVAGDK